MKDLLVQSSILELVSAGYLKWNMQNRTPQLKWSKQKPKPYTAYTANTNSENNAIFTDSLDTVKIIFPSNS